MLLFVVLIIDPSFLHILLGERGFFHLFGDLKQSIFFRQWPVVTSSFWDACHKPTTSLCLSLLIFQQLRSILLCKGAFQAHLWQKLAFSPPFCYSNDLSSILSPGGIVMLLFSLIILFCQDHVLFHAYQFNWSVVSIIPLLTGVSSKCFHFAKFKSYSFHVQPECCPNSSSLLLF